VTMLWARWLGSIPSRCREEIVSLHNHVQTSSLVYPASYPMGIRIPSLWVKWLGHDDQSLPSSTKVKNVQCCTSIPPYIPGVVLN